MTLSILIVDDDVVSCNMTRTVRDSVRSILMDLGIIGESGSKDIVALMEYAK